MQTEDVKDEAPQKSPVERHREFKAGGMYSHMFFSKTRCKDIHHMYTQGAP